MGIVIRPAEAKDLEKIYYIESCCFSEAEAATYDSLKERLAAFKQSFLVAEKENEIVGFVNGCVTKQRKLTDELYKSTKLHNEFAPCQMIFGLAVHPAAQRQGIASLLLQEFIVQARKRKKEFITLTCKKELIPFYEQFGYKNEGKSTSMHGGVCWYDMTLFLEDDK